MFARVSRVGNAIAEVEVERFKQTILEEMALNHPKVLNVFIADLKLDAVKKKNEKENERLLTM